MINWPFLNDEETLEKGQGAGYAKITNTGEEPGEALVWHAAVCGLLCMVMMLRLMCCTGRALPKPMKRDKSEAAKNVLDLLPDWVGYGVSPALVCSSCTITLDLSVGTERVCAQKGLIRLQRHTDNYLRECCRAPLSERAQVES